MAFYILNIKLKRYSMCLLIYFNYKDIRDFLGSSFHPQLKLNSHYSFTFDVLFCE